VPVTVGIATTGDDGRALRETVDGVLRAAALAGDDAEVLVVVNGRDRVPELSGVDSPMLRVCHLERRNVAVARNTVLAEARHDTILFTDDDCAVAPQWCRELSEALREPGYVAVGAPVRVTVTGPISAYFDYQRMYDAVAGWPTDSLLLVTANCGLRRDRIPTSIRFDPRLNTAGEDTGLSLALAKAGLPARWLADATPVRHGFSEEIEQITGRFDRNARHGVHLYLGQGHAMAAMPGVLPQYRQRIQDDYQHDRQFAEFAAPEARTAFTVYDSLARAAAALGYLDRIGAELGEPLIELDRDRLARSWREIDGLVRARVATLPPSGWAALLVDYRGMGDRLAPEPLLADVRRVLRRYARPVPSDPVGPVGDILNQGGVELGRGYVDALEAVRAAFDGVCSGTEPATPEALGRAVRALGVPWTVAGDMIELSLRVDFRRWIRAVHAGRGR
jgi:glycosyltransferase involved in cell wall biosynthesis